MSLKVTKGHLSFREFKKIHPNTFIYESILIKKKTHMNTQIFNFIFLDTQYPYTPGLP